MHIKVMSGNFGKAPVISGSTHHNRQDDSVAVEFSAHVVCGDPRPALTDSLCVVRYRSTTWVNFIQSKNCAEWAMSRIPGWLTEF